MDALELIKSSLTEQNVNQILSHFNIHMRSDGQDMLRSACPIHKGSNESAFCFNVEKGVYYCHSCGAYGDIVQLIQELNGWTKDEDFPKAVKWVLEALNISSENLEIKKRPNNVEKDLLEWKKFIKSKNSSVIPPIYKTAECEMKNVLTFRRFAKETLAHFGLKYAPNYPFQKRDGSTSNVQKRLCMPLIFYNKQVGLAMRRTNENEIPKWLFQPAGLDKKNIIYNMEDKWYENFTICEGTFDVWTFYEASIDSGAVLGKSITFQQSSLLRKHTLNLILAFDGDEAGRNATCIAIDNLKLMFNLSVINFDASDDPNTCGKARLRELYDNRLHYADWIKLHKEDWDIYMKQRRK